MDSNGTATRAEDLINSLPRSGRRFPNIVGWVDGAGNLNLEIVGGGCLVLNQVALGLLETNEDDFSGGD